MASVQIPEAYKSSYFPLLSELEAWFVGERARKYEVFISQPILHEGFATSVAVSYLLAIILLKSWMKDRPAYKLQTPLFVWNVVLCIYSLVSVVRTLPEMVDLFQGESGWNGVACNARHRKINTAVWGMLFQWSKVLEMGDTVFILLRKQKLIFLHWYHHLVTFIYVWIAFTEHTSVSRLFSVMNYTVHTAMYAYYASKVWRIRLPKAVNIFITSLQLMQMVMGVGVTVYVCIERASGRPCQTPSNHLTWSLAMYGSYLALFANFFYKTYITSPKTEISITEKAKEKRSTGVTMERRQINDLHHAIPLEINDINHNMISKKYQ